MPPFPLHSCNLYLDAQLPDDMVQEQYRSNDMEQRSGGSESF